MFESHGQMVHQTSIQCFFWGCLRWSAMFWIDSHQTWTVGQLQTTTTSTSTTTPIPTPTPTAAAAAAATATTTTTTRRRTTTTTPTRAATTELHWTTREAKAMRQQRHWSGGTKHNLSHQLGNTTARLTNIMHTNCDVCSIYFTVYICICIHMYPMYPHILDRDASSTESLKALCNCIYLYVCVSAASKWLTPIWHLAGKVSIVRLRFGNGPARGSNKSIREPVWTTRHPRGQWIEFYWN